ncbi:MAG: DUF6382 domain-containing protein [Lachnospiraceae bacterium]|nr:DUF6382 domain-containing protein [Lachnospiraceae bacterium]
MERKITIEEAIEYEEDYQMRMLTGNAIAGILPVRGRGFNGHSCYDYDVSGKISMRALYERNEISAKDMKRFLECLSMAIEEVQKYLLNIHCILLDPEYIFYEEEQFYFCYYPPAASNLWENFHELTEYFVKRADYQDEESVQIVFLLHKETMIENYSLEKIVNKCIYEKEESKENEKIENKTARKSDRELQNDLWKDREVRYDTREHDWIVEQEMGSLIMEETENLWTPVRRFLKKHKKTHWGEWDELHIEEEEL